MLSDTLHITRAWPESYMVPLPDSIPAIKTVPTTTDSIADFIILTLILLFFILAYRRIVEGIYYTAGAVFNLKKLLIIENQSNTKGSRDTLLLFSFLTAAFVLSDYNARYHFIENRLPVYLNFIFILLILGGYILFKIVSYTLLDWANNTSVFKTLHKIGYTYTIWGFLTGLAGLIVFLIFPQIGSGPVGIYTGICALTAFFLYFIRGYQLIIANRFSHFFWILYLCTFEILPVLLAAFMALSS